MPCQASLAGGLQFHKALVMVGGIEHQPVVGKHNPVRPAVAPGVVAVRLVILAAGLFRQKPLIIAELDSNFNASKERLYSPIIERKHSDTDMSR